MNRKTCIDCRKPVDHPLEFRCIPCRESFWIAFARQLCPSDPVAKAAWMEEKHREIDFAALPEGAAS